MAESLTRVTKNKKEKKLSVHGQQSDLREHPKGQEITLAVPTLPACKLQGPCSNLNVHTGEAAQANG